MGPMADPEPTTTSALRARLEGRGGAETDASQVVSILEIIHKLKDQIQAKDLIIREKTAELLALGEKTFLGDQGCARCHGIDGSGEGPLAPGLMDDWQGDIAPAALRTGLFKQVKTERDLYRRITLGIPGTPMFPSELETRQKWAVVFHVQGLIAAMDSSPLEAATISK